MKVGAGLDSDILVLDLFRGIPDKCGVSIRLIGRVVDDPVSASHKSPDTVLHDVVDLFCLIPLLQLHDDHIAPVVLISTCDHKIHAFRSPRDLVLNRDVSVARDLRIVDHRTHKLQGILPGVELRCLSAGDVLFPEVSENNVGNPVQNHVIVELCLSCAVYDHLMSPLACVRSTSGVPVPFDLWGSLLGGGCRSTSGVVCSVGASPTSGVVKFVRPLG